MSATDNVLASHNPSISYNQQNGDNLSSQLNVDYNLATMESIGSVHENPFYKSFGIKHLAPSYPRQHARTNDYEQPKNIHEGESSSFDEDIGEYHPGSGYVHKLMDKFSSLTAREELPFVASHLKKFSSLDELSAENDTDHSSVIRTKSRGYEKSSYLAGAKLSQKAKSIDNLNQTHVRLRQSQTASPTNHLDHHLIARNFEFPNEDILIIENSIVDSVDGENEIETPKVLGNLEVIPDELPKPNTVLTVRSIFESAAAESGVHIKRSKQESLSSKVLTLLHTPEDFSSRPDSASDHTNQHSQSSVRLTKLSNDVHASFVPLSQNSVSKHSVVKPPRHHSSFQQTRGDGVLSPTHFVSSHSYDDRPHNSETNQRLSTKNAPDVQHAASTQSPTRKTSASTHATSSSSISTENRHSSSLTTVTSLTKDKKEENKSEELPFMILSASELRSRNNKKHKTKENSPAFNTSSEFQSQEYQEADKIVVLSDVQINSNSDEYSVTSEEIQVNIVASHRKLFDTDSKMSLSNFNDKNKTLSVKQYSSQDNKNSSHPTPVPRKRSDVSNYSQNGVIANGEVSIEAQTGRSKRSHPQDLPPLSEQPSSKVSKDKATESVELVKGIPSIISQRLKKQNSEPSQFADNVISSMSSTEFGTDDASSRKLMTSTSRSSSLDSNDKDSLTSEIESEIAAVRKKMEGNRVKSSGPAQIFDSSQLAQKRKEKKLQKAAALQEAQNVVPVVNLSVITHEQVVEYKPRRGPPSNIVFIGENAKTSRSLLNKQRKIKIHIHFNDAKTETFEYPNEETALERYLEEHPHERDEILVLEDFGGREDYSDDVEIDVFETPVTLRGNAEEDLLKANTALAHSGSLQSYRGRFQQDYEFGSILLQQPEETSSDPEPGMDPDKLMLRPAEEDDTNTWSTSSSSDILF